jgi:hypothetical protein
LLLAAVVAAADAGAGDLPELEPGAWVEIPGTRLRDVAPPVSPGGNVSKIIDAWSGGAFDSAREWLLVWGGGHSDYGGNELYAFDLKTLAWTRLTDPSVPDRARTATYPDGQPRARHTYNYVEYVPAWDRFVSFGGAGPWPTGGGEFTRQISEFDYEHRTWITGAHSPVPAGGSMIAAIARLDASTGDIYFVPASKGYLLRFDPRTEQWQGGWGRSQVTAHASAAIDTARRLLVVVGKGTADGVRQALKWDLSRPSAPVDLRKLTSGDVAAERAMAPGFAYHPPSRTFVAWTGGTDLLALDPETWQWRTLAAAPGTADPGAPSPRGTYGRFQYVPRLDAFVLVNDVDQNVFIVRPDLGGEPPTPGVPPPAISLIADPNEVGAGESPTLSWTADGAKRCEAFGGWHGARELRGTAEAPFEGWRARFGLRCTGRGGRSETSVEVSRTSPPSVSITAKPRVVERGGRTTIAWNATPTSRCTARGAWHGPRTAQGTEVIDGIVAGSRFMLECEGAGGSKVAATSVQLASAGPGDEPPAPASESRTSGVGGSDAWLDALLVIGLAIAMRRREWRARSRYVNGSRANGERSHVA